MPQLAPEDRHRYLLEEDRCREGGDEHRRLHLAYGFDEHLVDRKANRHDPHRSEGCRYGHR